MPPYAYSRDRKKSLTTLGFSSYAEYLKSDLWQEIRIRVLTRDSYKCRRCKGDANQVHHRDYKLPTMQGERMDSLISLCRDCHHNLEYDGERKRRPSEVHRIDFGLPKPWCVIRRERQERRKKFREQKYSSVPATEKQKNRIILLCEQDGVLPDAQRLAELNQYDWGVWEEEIFKKRKAAYKASKRAKAAQRRQSPKS